MKTSILQCDTSTKRSTMRIVLGIALIISLLNLSCAVAEKEEKCTNAECYGQCLGQAWSDLTESYWVFNAFCVEGNMCNCLSHCDDTKCNDYCIDEYAASSGSCDIFDCVCSGVSEDAGVDTSTCTDEGCYDKCKEAAWSDLTENYWDFEAFCTDEKDTCNCLSSCDDTKCNDFCIDERSASGGSCDLFDCVCSGLEDAGPDASI